MWKFGELARATGVSVRALHHYDRIGLHTTVLHSVNKIDKLLSPAAALDEGD